MVSRTSTKRGIPLDASRGYLIARRGLLRDQPTMRRPPNPPASARVTAASLARALRSSAARCSSRSVKTPPHHAKPSRITTRHHTPPIQQPRQPHKMRLLIAENVRPRRRPPTPLLTHNRRRLHQLPPRPPHQHQRRLPLRHQILRHITTTPSSHHRTPILGGYERDSTRSEPATTRRLNGVRLLSLWPFPGMY